MFFRHATLFAAAGLAAAEWSIVAPNIATICTGRFDRLILWRRSSQKGDDAAHGMSSLQRRLSLSSPHPLLCNVSTGITCTSNMTCYAPVGANGVGSNVLTSHDAGNTWTPAQTDPFALLLLDVAAINDNVVVIGALESQYSLDGGKTFAQSGGKPGAGQCVRAIGAQGGVQNGFAEVGDFGLFVQDNGVAISMDSGCVFAPLVLFSFVTKASRACARDGGPRRRQLRRPPAVAAIASSGGGRHQLRRPPAVAAAASSCGSRYAGGAVCGMQQWCSGPRLDRLPLRLPLSVHTHTFPPRAIQHELHGR